MGSILITGANRGIGLELACQYAEAGEKVIATYRDVDAANALRHLAEAYATVEVRQLDVCRADSIDRLAGQVREDGQEIAILINNAGVLAQESFGRWSAAAFERTFATNVAGPGLMAQAFKDLFAAEAKIVNISSGIGSFGLSLGLGGGMGSYAASKAGLNMLTAHLAAALRGRGVLAVAFSPGWVKTDMGGQEADLDVETSVAGLRAVIDRLTLEDSGKFFSYTGELLPW